MGVPKILPGLNDEEVVVEQVVLSAEIPQDVFSPSFLPPLHCLSFLPIMHPVHYRSSHVGDGHLQTRHHDHPVEQADGRGGHVL